MSLLLHLVLSAAALAPRGEDVVARVGSWPVTSTALAERLAAYRDAGVGMTARGALEDLVNDALMAQEAERQGLSRDPAVLADVDGERRRLAARRLLEREIFPAAAVDEAGLKRLYHLGADSARLRLLVYASEGEAAAASERLRREPDFRREAPRALGGASGPGGELGLRSRVQLDPALAEAVFSAAAGAILGPVKLELGWGVAQVLERQVGDDAGFQAQREPLRSFAEAQARAAVEEHYLRGLRQAAAVHLDQAFLDGLGTRVEPTPEEAGHVLATVAGRPLRYGDIVPKLERLSRGKTGGHLSGPRVKAEVASAEIDRLLLEEAAVRRGDAGAPEVAAGVARYRVVALARGLATRLRRREQPSEEDARAYYREHRTELTGPASRSCAHVLLDDRKQAEAARARLERGEPFESVARALSRDASTAASGGRMGDLTDAQIDLMSTDARSAELARAIREAGPGALAGPVQSGLGWHLVRCEAPRAPPPVPFEDVRAGILARLAAERGDAAVRSRIAALRAATPVAVDEAALGAAAARQDGAGGSPPRKDRP